VLKQVSERVCIVTSVHSPFDTRIFHKQAKTLVRAGYDVRLIAQHQRDEEIEGVRVIALPKPQNRFTRIFGLTWRAFLLALRQQADIHHFHDPEFLPWGWLLQKITHKPVIYDVHEYYADSIRMKDWLPRTFRGMIASIFNCFEKTIARRLAGIVVVNGHLGKQFSDRGCQVCVLPNYPPKGLFEILPSPTNLQHTYEKHQVLIYIGGLSESRGITQAIRVMKRLCKKFPKVKLLLAGRFESDLYQQEVMQLIERLNLADNVDILGFLPHSEVIRYLAVADVGIFLLQPVNERYNWGEPIKYFEYSASGLPVVISDLPAKRRLIEKNQNGILVDPLDEEKIAESIASLLRDQQEMKEMGKRGRDAFLREYNWEAIEERLIDLYKKLTGES
jgi:glycosyltransferase involved in cell wall biosynthesis